LTERVKTHSIPSETHREHGFAASHFERLAEQACRGGTRRKSKTIRPAPAALREPTSQAVVDLLILCIRIRDEKGSRRRERTSETLNPQACCSHSPRPNRYLSAPYSSTTSFIRVYSIKHECWSPAGKFVNRGSAAAKSESHAMRPFRRADFHEEAIEPSIAHQRIEVRLANRLQSGASWPSSRKQLVICLANPRSILRRSRIYYNTKE